MTNRLISEALGTVAVIPPSAQAVGALATAAILPNQARKILFTLTTGALGGAGAVDLKVQASQDGVTFVDVPGAAIATINAANAGSGVAQVEVRADRLVALNLGPYCRAVVTVSGNAVPTALVAQGGDVRYLFASDLNIAGTPAVVLV